MPHVIFVHGISNKPAADQLVEIWRRKLAASSGIDLDDRGITSDMVYWADVLYPSPDTNLAAYESAASPEVGQELKGPGVVTPPRVSEPRGYQKLLASFDADGDDEPAALDEAQANAVMLERVPLPAFLRKRLMKTLARDAYLYLFNEPFSPRPAHEYKVRDVLRQRFRDAVTRARETSDTVVVVSHSMGTIIAYDTLASVPDCPAVDGLVTVGSPLGVDEVQDFFDGYSPDRAYPAAKVGEWVNVFDRLDVVAGVDPMIGRDFRHDGEIKVRDIEEPNWGTWRHSVSKYLQGRQLREALARMLGTEWP
jgi:hypothetical protein